MVGGNAINLQASVCVLPSHKASPLSRVEQQRDSTRVQGQAGNQPEGQDRLASSPTMWCPSGSHAVNVTAHLKDAMLSPQSDTQPVGTPSCIEQRTWGQASGAVPRALNKASTPVPSGAASDWEVPAGRLESGAPLRTQTRKFFSLLLLSQGWTVSLGLGHAYYSHTEWINKVLTVEHISWGKP